MFIVTKYAALNKDQHASKTVYHTHTLDLCGSVERSDLEILLNSLLFMTNIFAIKQK